MSDSQPPYGPPSGPPPQGPPDQISYGWQPTEPEPQRGSARKWLLVGGGVVAAGAIVAGAAFGAASVLGGHKDGAPTPAEALPASTFAYASIDASPSDGQLGALLGILAKFPGATKHLSLSGSGATTDPRKMVFDAVADSDGGFGACKLSWDDDLAPWLGTKFAIAGVAVGDKPQPVVVAQVTDTAKATTEIGKLQGCDHSATYALSGDWMLIAPKLSVIDAVTKGAASGTLADDSTYQHWMGEVGDPGIVEGYVAPSAGAMLADYVKKEAGASAGSGLSGSDSQMLSSICPAAGTSSSSSSQAMLRGFRGAAMSLRVKDGGIEAESAADMGTGGAAGAVTGTGTAGAQLVTGLPADTSAAIGLSVAPNPWESMVTAFSKACGGTTDPSQINSLLGSVTGLDLPGDIDTLLGKGLTLSVGPLDEGTLDQVGSDPSKLPVALQLTGDASGISKVVDKVLAKVSQVAGAPVGSVVGVDANGDRVAVGPDSDYRKAVLANGGLGQDPTFQNAVPDASRATAIMYVDLNRFDSFVKAQGGSAYTDYYQPLQAVGVAGWVDSDHVSHAMLRVTTD